MAFNKNQISIVILIIAFAILTYLVQAISSFSLDLRITHSIQSIDFAAFNGIMVFFSWAGFPPQSVVLMLLFVGLIYFLGLRWEAAVTLLGGIFGQLLNWLIKELIHRDRPSGDLVNVVLKLDSYSFPSGHVMFYTEFFGFICFLAFVLLRPSWKRNVILILFGSQVLAVGISRIYLGAHWASDVLGAYLLGSLCLIAIIQFYRWGKPRYFV
ncbi:phosphatase PAP2 family protein [Paenibacillus psychroresistens]|uniref:Phosphatase PAP2 family protein n=1 Tax=Paenibacillus psychroresistens TaxID=1778678 RepID=A0A6B8RLP4_9BACL|nr:phosphatase PAP2 family protein [Paenibacillus psychroresistens]QGQ96463.1 phosphatase PAP2 family protein [Paenibacillus psychroresistens]